MVFPLVVKKCQTKMETKVSILKKFLSRKFVITLLSLISASLLRWFGKIYEGVYSVVMVATLGVYQVTNVAQKTLVKLGQTGEAP